MELISVGFLGGVVTCLIIFGAGILYANYSEKHIDEPAEDMTGEDAENALLTMRIGMSRTERDAIDYAIRSIRAVKDIKAWIKEKGGN